MGKLKTATKAQSQANRLNTRKKIMSMPQYAQQQEFTRLDAMAQCGLECSVATMCLRDMVSANLLTVRVADDNGTMVFKANRKPECLPWRPTNADMSYVPRWY